MTDALPSLAPVSSALNHLSRTIRFGRTTGRPSLEESVDRAGFAIADLHGKMESMLRHVMWDMARGVGEGSAPPTSGSGT